MKHLRILLVFLLALAVFSGSALGWTPVTITDDSGFASIIENQPQTIVSLAPTNTEIIFALGLGDKVAGVTEYCNYPTEALAIQKIGGYATVNIEKIVAADPDIIFANPKNGQENIDSLRQLGYTVIGEVKCSSYATHASTIIDDQNVCQPWLTFSLTDPTIACNVALTPERARTEERRPS